MQTSCIRGKRRIKKGLVLLAILTVILSLSLVIINKNLYVTVHDNLDSNIVWLKMAKENRAFGNEDVAIPFLGGKANLKVGFTLWSAPFYFFSPLVAYCIIIVLKFFLSGLGFYVLSCKINKYSSYNLDQDIFCFCGIIYGLLGTWPSASIGYALLPWWALLFYILSKTKKVYLYIFLFLFAREISLPLLGIFALFFTFIYIIFICIKDRKVNFPLCGGFIILACIYYFFNRNIISDGLSSSESTIKSLAASNYNDSFFESLSKFKDAFLMKDLYHSGGADLRLLVIPLCTVMFIISIFRIINKRKKETTFLYICFFSFLVINCLACCFDNNDFFRTIISFAVGFQFSRFAWLSPFFWMLLFALLCGEIKNKLIKYFLPTLAILIVFLGVGYTQASSIYNMGYINTAAIIGETSAINGDNGWQWGEFYSEKLFEQIKKDIEYNNEWSAAYGVDCSVLQYNGIKTIDGYYSNYFLEYHDTFQKMIQPELDIDEYHKEYWKKSTGIRAYLYSPNWIRRMPKNSDIKEDYLYIDSSVFANDLNGKYLFSRVRVTNADELGFNLLGVWNDEESPYTIYVYTISPESVQSARAKEGYNKWQNSVPVNKVYGSGSLFTSGNAFSSDDGLLLYPGGSVYGPYKPLKKGHYSVSYVGNNMDIAICDVLSYSSQEYYFTEKSRSSDKIVLDLTVLEDIENVEYRVFNNVPDQVIQLTQIVVEAE